MDSSSGFPATRRLIKELSDYRADPNPCLELLEPVSEDDLLHWHALLKGVENTPYEGGKWRIDIKIPANYPYSPPIMTFLTGICHPNVHLKTGEICLDLLKTNWSPAYTISMTLTAIHQLLQSPEPDSPLNVDAAAVLRTGDNVGYESLVRLWGVLHAGKPASFNMVG
ncbi:ubiquitin-conjugating enzyme/RWD-like protein [Morchella snyderi]|nr:ubiquitin-conjugating enzyme/RWD-like protein [Morchella snyderi]